MALRAVNREREAYLNMLISIISTHFSLMDPWSSAEVSPHAQESCIFAPASWSRNLLRVLVRFSGNSDFNSDRHGSSLQDCSLKRFPLSFYPHCCLYLFSSMLESLPPYEHLL